MELLLAYVIGLFTSVLLLRNRRLNYYYRYLRQRLSYLYPQYEEAFIRGIRERRLTFLRCRKCFAPTPERFVHCRICGHDNWIRPFSFSFHQAPPWAHLEKDIYSEDTDTQVKATDAFLEEKRKWTSRSAKWASWEKGRKAAWQSNKGAWNKLRRSKGLE